MPLSLDSDEVFTSEKKNKSVFDVAESSRDRIQRLRELRRQKEEVEQQKQVTA